jgi:hypothetical protein
MALSTLLRVSRDEDLPSEVPLAVLTGGSKNTRHNDVSVTPSGCFLARLFGARMPFGATRQVSVQRSFVEIPTNLSAIAIEPCLQL